MEQWMERRGEEDCAENGWKTSRSGVERMFTYSAGSTGSRHVENGGAEALDPYGRPVSPWSNEWMNGIVRGINKLK